MGGTFRGMLRLAPLVLLALLASAASAESVWLRGRGDDVWIERDGAVASRTQDAAAASEQAPDAEDVRPGVTRVVTSADPAIARSYRSREARREAYERRFEEPPHTVVYLRPSYPDPPYVYPMPVWNDSTGWSGSAAVDPSVYGFPYAPRPFLRAPHLRAPHGHHGFHDFGHHRHRGFHRDRHFGRHRHRGFHRDPVIRIPSAVSFGGEDGGFVTRGGAYRRR